MIFFRKECCIANSIVLYDSHLFQSEGSVGAFKGYLVLHSTDEVALKQVALRLFIC